MQPVPSSGGGMTVRREIVIEIAGYVGAAVGLAAVGVALAFASLALRSLADLVMIAVLVGAGLALAGDSDQYRRMRSVFWFVSVGVVSNFAGLIFNDALHPGERSAGFLIGALTAAFAFVLWSRSKRSLQLIALFLAAYAALAALFTPQLSPFVFLAGGPNFTGLGLVTWIWGGAWVAAGWRDLVQPKRTAMVLGGIAAIVGPLMLGDPHVLAALISLASACAVLVVGDLLDDRAVAGLGIAGVIFASVVLVSQNIHSDIPATFALLVGLVLLAGAVAAARGTTAPPPPVPPPPPFASGPPEGN